MPVEMSMWRIDGDQPRRLTSTLLPTEKTLEDFLTQDPSLLGLPLLAIGRQVRTPHGKFIDLLTIDGDGNLHVLELKRDKTPRDVVAQTLDYGSWVTTLGREEVIDMASAHLGRPLEAAFDDAFGESLPDDLNGELQLTIVATDLDGSSERIVTYLRTFGVPINAVFFSYLEDEGRNYLARSWLATSEEGTSAKPGATKKVKRAEWNRRDWYVSFGVGLSRSWEDGSKFGFVSAGGGVWYSRTLRSLPVGARVNVYIPGHGYVAIGETLAEASRFDKAKVLVDGKWVTLSEQDLKGSYTHGEPGQSQTDEIAEFVVPVRWIASHSMADAYRETGMFSSQHSACKLRQEFTLDRLAEHFGIGGEEEWAPEQPR